MEMQTLWRKIQEKTARIAIFGLGRIGLPTAVEFASHGFHVLGIDLNEQLLSKLKESKCFIDEPGLMEILRLVNDQGLLEYTPRLQEAVEVADFIIICLPTPVDENNVPNYDIICKNAQEISKHLRKGQIYIMESSVSPTTIESLLIPILEKGSGLKINQDFGACACPERADPGKIVDNFDTVTRIIGGSSQEVTDLVVGLYSQVTKAELFVVSKPGTANAVKLTENIFRDVNIALMNEFAVLYELLGIDTKEVIAGCSTKYNFVPHFPGPGVGGPCLPANPYYIIKDAAKVNYIPLLIRVAREINDRMPVHIRDLVIHALNYAGLCVKGTKITILGISYKANVRDIQISPALKVIDQLKELKADLHIYDPFFRGEIIQNLRVANTLEEALDDTNIIVVLTEHDEFKKLDFKELLPPKKGIILVDSRNIFDIDQLPLGTVYCGVGRPLQVREK